MKSKILFILHFPPPVHGAAMVGKYIKESKLVNNEFDTDFINLSTSSNLSEGGKDGLKKIFKLLQIQAKILKSLIKKKYDLCYVTLTSSGQGFYKDLLIVFLLKLFDKKIIYHFHNKGISIAGKKRHNDWLYRYTFKNTQTILLSEYLYYDVEKYVKKENVFYCPNGIPEIFGDHKNSAVVDKNKPCRLLYLGNMMVEKGVYTLMEACRELKNKKVSFKCDFVGGWSDITEDDFKKNLIKNNLSDVVFSHGPKYDDEKHSFFDDADIFVFPTFYHYEALPIVNLEAMQHNLPIISTTVGGIRDEIVDGETGFLIPPNDIEILVEKLELLIHSRELRLDMGLRGAKRFKDLFTLSKFEQNFTDILKQAVTEKC